MFNVKSNNHIYTFDEFTVDAPKPQKEVTHHVLVIDRSGSMWGDIEALKSSIEQVLAVEDMTNPDVETSLISFSSHGDVRLHWSRVRVEDVNKLTNPYLGELRSIQATALTGISQGLELGLEQVQSGQTTGITLFTDGYANDPSAAKENKALDAFVEKVKANHPNVFVNCIGYRDWCDWPRMMNIANELSGKCVRATSFKTVLDAMKDTQELLSSSMRPAVSLPGIPNRATLAVNMTTGNVYYAAEGQPLTLRGFGAEDQLRGFRINRLPLTTKSVGKRLAKDSMWLAGALSLGLLNVGELREAKGVLQQSGNKTLWEAYATAITPSVLVAMAGGLRVWVEAQNNAAYVMGRNMPPKYSIYDFAEALETISKSSKSFGVSLNVTEFFANYRRRTVKRVPGTRDEQGVLTELDVRGESFGPTFIRGLSFNRSEATVQLDTVQGLSLVEKNGSMIHEVGGIPLNRLQSYRSYTLISSGEMNVKQFDLVMRTPEAHKLLAPFSTTPRRPYKTLGALTFRLRNFDLTQGGSPPRLENVTAIVVRVVAMNKILSAIVDKAEVSGFAPDQIEALKKVHLTPALYFSPPTTTPYSSREEAIAKGEIDSYTRYVIGFESINSPRVGDLRSGNAMLDRYYTVKNGAGEVIPKPKLTLFNDPQYSYEPKKLSARSVETAADAFMKPLLDVCIEQRLTTNWEEQLDRNKKQLDTLYGILRPLVMEIGATGMLPKELESRMARFEADAFETQFKRKLSKSEKEGVFYVDLSTGEVISICPVTEWYSTGANMDHEQE